MPTALNCRRFSRCPAVSPTRRNIGGTALVACAVGTVSRAAGTVARGAATACAAGTKVPV